MDYVHGLCWKMAVSRHSILGSTGGASRGVTHDKWRTCNIQMVKYKNRTVVIANNREAGKLGQ